MYVYVYIYIYVHTHRQVIWMSKWFPNEVIQNIYEHDGSYKVHVDKVSIQLKTHYIMYRCNLCCKPFNHCCCYCEVRNTYRRFCYQIYGQWGHSICVLSVAGLQGNGSHRRRSILQTPVVARPAQNWGARPRSSRGSWGPSPRSRRRLAAASPRCAVNIHLSLLDLLMGDNLLPIYGRVPLWRGRPHALAFSHPALEGVEQGGKPGLRLGMGNPWRVATPF